MPHFLKGKALFDSSLVAESEYPGRYRLWIWAWILAGPGGMARHRAFRVESV
jgi:hypothetical protein